MAIDRDPEGALATSRLLAGMLSALSPMMYQIRGLAELAERTPERDWPELVGVIGAEARRAGRIVAELRDLANLESGRHHVDIVDFEPRTVVAEAIDRARESAEVKGLTLVSEVASALPSRLLGDPQRIGEALSNLIHAAVRYSEDGVIRVVVDVVGDRWRVTVTDPRPEFDLQGLAKLLVLFGRYDCSADSAHGEAVRRVASSQRMASFLGGSVVLVRRPKRGAELVLELPLTDAWR